MTPFRVLDVLQFDPSELPRPYVRFVRAATTIGALLFGAVAAWGYVATSRALDSRASDIEAALTLMKAGFLFVLTGACGGMSLVLAIIAARCWRA
jgi:NhaP-type Na+/H+ or K+/H+ antiporter